jgi:glycosyltransferase involved in cell wall biosynthesis
MAGLGAAGRQAARDRFGWSRHVEAYQELYEQLHRDHEAARG